MRAGRGRRIEIDIVKGNSSGAARQQRQLRGHARLSAQATACPTTRPLARVGEEIDLESFIAYHALQIFVGNADTLNVKRYRNLNADGKWHWAIFDLDWGFYS